MLQCELQPACRCCGSGKKAHADRSRFPEESFVEISPTEYERRWAEQREWWRREQVGELGHDRIGWACRTCNTKYWAHLIEFRD